MTWEKQLEKYEHDKDWESAIELMRDAIDNDGLNMNAYLSLNYMLMNLLVEDDYDRKDYNFYADTLLKYFKESYSKFSNNPEYLFFIGIMAHMSEWYFNITIEEAKAMIKEALRLDPENILYKWGYYSYLDMSDNEFKKIGADYAKKVLEGGSPTLKKLKSKGALGKYVLEIMTYSRNK